MNNFFQPKPLVIGLSLALATTGSLAQERDTSLALEEVIITAQKRTENLQDVPVSVSAIGGSELEMLKYRDAGEIAAQIPNLQTTNTSGEGFPIFSLRGVSMSDFSFNQSSFTCFISQKLIGWALLSAPG